MERIKIHTTKGDLIIRLYDETPIHRDNFLKLVDEGYYNGTLFHRVIRDFMIQGGDPDSINAPADKMLGVGGPDYTLEAEINEGLFHRRGALAAARQGDEVNPERQSSGSQFYIVWGQTYNDGQLQQLDKQLQMQALQSVFNGLVAQHRAEILQFRKERNRVALQELQDRLEKEARAQIKAQGPMISPAQIEAYTTIGGTPYLDGQYTVFGEVEDGLGVVDVIQQMSTRRGDRPVEDVVVLGMERL